MANYAEVVSMVLDLLKERSNDSYYTEEHVIFLASKMRALLLRRKIRGSRNKSYEVQARDNMQQICLHVEPAAILPDGCDGLWLKSTEKIPELLDEQSPVVYAVSDLIRTTLTYIPRERMPYVGYNKWLKNIIYVSRSSDGYMYLQGGNSQFAYLEDIKFEAVFENAEEASKLACDGDGSASCDIFSQRFPLDDALLPTLIEMVVQELAGPRYALDDMKNNDRDDLSNAAAHTRTASPATREDRDQQNREMAE